MGICISYKGSLSDPAMFDEALHEIREFAKRSVWQCEDFEEHYSGVLLATQAEADGDVVAESSEDEPWPELPEGQYRLRARVSRLHPPPLFEETARGVIVQPPDTEPVRLVFDSSGRLVRYMDFPEELIVNAMPDTVHYAAFPNFVKTSGAPASHATICLLLKMLQQKFMLSLEVNDDTDYWQHGSITRLQQKHLEMTALLGIFHESKDVGALLRSLGVEIPEGEVELLDTHLPEPAPAKKQKKMKLN